MRKYLLLLSLLVLTACSSTNTLVKHEEPIEKQQKSYEIEPNTDNEYDVYFGEALDKALQNKGMKSEGELSDTVIKYSVAFDEGNRALRYFVGFGAGQAKALIDVKAYNKKDKKLLANLESEAVLSMGIFGGEAKGILDAAAQDIVRRIITMGLFERTDKN